MHIDTPHDFHRQRIAMLADTLGVWMDCGHAACRRAGCCRRANDVFPACILPVLREVGVSIRACTAAIPDRAPAEGEEQSPAGSVTARINRLNARTIALLERNITRLESEGHRPMEPASAVGDLRW